MIRAAGIALRGADLRKRLPVLGVPVEIQTNSPVVLKAVETVLGKWRPEAQPETGSATRRTPRICLLLDGDGAVPEAEIVVRSPATQRIELDAPGIRARGHGTALTAACVLSPSILRDPYLFEEQVLATLALFLVTRCDRQPLHAAAIARERRCLLLLGRSGAGKSTLAYAALRNGWKVLADDAVYLQSAPVGRIWTRPARLHLPAEAAERFPELMTRPLVRRENGRWKFCVEPEDRGLVDTRPYERATLCLLENDPGAADSCAVDLESAISTVLASVDGGFAVFRDTIGPALRAVVEERAYIVRRGPDPLRTLALLAEIEAR